MRAATKFIFFFSGVLGAANSSPPAFIPSLKFNDARNSQNVPVAIGA